jgi:hypothetical protein
VLLLYALAATAPVETMSIDTTIDRGLALLWGRHLEIEWTARNEPNALSPLSSHGHDVIAGNSKPCALLVEALRHND